MDLRKPRCFCIAQGDNVAVLLNDAVPGACSVLGEAGNNCIELVDSIPLGHKVALNRLNTGESVIKYGIVIGTASQSIESGQHVHLHNCASVFDSRSSTLQVDTGSPTDTPYE